MTRRVVALSICVALIVGCDSSPVSLTVSVPTEEPAPYISATLQTVLLDERIELIERLEVAASASQTGIEMLLAGTVDLAIIDEPPERIPGLTAIVPLYPSILHVLKRKDTDAASFGELIRGQGVFTGVGGKASRLLEQLVSGYGLSPRDYQVLADPWSVEPDVYFIVGGLLQNEGIGTLTDYELYSFGDVDDFGNGSPVDGFALQHRNVRPFVLPQHVYGTYNAAAVLTVQTRTLLVARDDLDEDIAYRIARSLIQNNQTVGTAYPLVTTELNASIRADDLALPLHSGARRFIDKDEPGFLERYADVIGVALTVIAAIGSAVLAAFRVARARRKDRIDVYYRRILSVREALNASEIKSIKNNDLEMKIKEIQEEVLQLLIEERLNVDESLTLFFDLSNRVLHEISARSALNSAD